MSFKVTDKKRIDTYTDTVEGLLLMRKNINKTWTAESLQDMLKKEHGINDISLEDLKRVNDALYDRGIIADAQEADSQEIKEG